jgi:hypothetical protein
MVVSPTTNSTTTKCTDTRSNVDASMGDVDSSGDETPRKKAGF